jgi:hypothetical protein
MHGLTPGPLQFDAAGSVQHAAATHAQEARSPGRSCCEMVSPRLGKSRPSRSRPARFTRVLRGSVDLQTVARSALLRRVRRDASTGRPAFAFARAQPRPGRFAGNSGRPRTAPANGRRATAAFSPPAQSPPRLKRWRPQPFPALCVLPIPSSELVSHAFGTDRHPQKHEPRRVRLPCPLCALSSTRWRPGRGLRGDDSAGGRATQFQSGPCRGQPLPRRNTHRCGMQPPHGWQTPRLSRAMVWRRLSERHYFPQQPAPEPIDALGNGRVTSRLAVVLNEFASAASDQSALALASVFNSQQIISARLIHLPDLTCG